MSASENLSSALFHGTMAKLKPGDIVEPRSGVGYGAQLAFATPHHGAARAFATPDEGEKGYIYHVEPVDKEEQLGGGQIKGFPKGVREVTSKKGFKVVKKVPRKMSLERQNNLTSPTK